MQPSREDNELFSRQKINFRPPDPITHLVAGNNHIVMALSSGSLLRIPLHQPEKQIEMPIIRNSSDKISYLFLDPSGSHTLVSTEQGDVFYLHKDMQKPKHLQKLKSHIISAVGWNSHLSLFSHKEGRTGFILLGTTKGRIFETEINSAGTLLYLKQVYTLDTTDEPITGIFLGKCAVQTNRWMILICTITNLYPLAGVLSGSVSQTSSKFSLSGEAVPITPSALAATFGAATDLAPVCALENLFQQYRQNPGRIHSMGEDPNRQAGSLKFISGLGLYPPVGDDPPSGFCWLTSLGVKYGRIDTTAADPFKLTTDDQLISHPEVVGRPEFPLGMCLTEFHLVLLYSNRLTAISTLNETVAYEDILGQKFGAIRGLCRDATTGVLWMYTDSCVLKYRPEDEARDVWRIYLDKGDYITARKFASGKQDALDLVLKTEAEKLVAENKFVAAAELFAMTRAPFEETALRFVTADNRNGLKTFLEKKLDQLDNTDKTQEAMLVMWLLELHLTDLGDAKAGTLTTDDEPVAPLLNQEKQRAPSGSASFDTANYRQLRQKFTFFLGRPIVLECLRTNPEAVYQMMTNHGDLDSLLYFTEVLKDYEKQLDLFVQQEMYDSALAVLKRQAKPALFYKYSPSLITSNVAGRLVDSWIEMGSRLKPKRILPACFHCDKTKELAKQASRYLEFCIEQLGNRELAIHNYLLSLYSRFEPDKLIVYLQKQGNDAESVPYDVKYALRISSERAINEACIHIYTVLGLWEEAMRLALKENLEMGKRVVQKLTQIESHGHWSESELCALRKKLWLKIAQAIVERDEGDAMEQCLQLMREAGGLIHIQDMLPFFPKFATIEHFRDSLCSSLKEHSGKIKELQRDMKEATEVAEDIRKDLARLKKRPFNVEVGEKCGICREPVMIRDFFAFKCTHCFHADCLRLEAEKHFLTKEEADRARILADEVKTGSGSAQARDSLEDLIASECLWCGSRVVSSISRPFFTPSEYVEELRSWNLQPIS